MERNEKIQEENLAVGKQLLEKELPDVYSFLGIQLERLDEARITLESKGIPQPWPVEDVRDIINIEERYLSDELQNWASKGIGYVQSFVKDGEAELRNLLCTDGEVRDDILALESDVQGAIYYVATAIIGLVAAGIPAAIAGAAASIATTIAVILIKNKLSSFCSLESAVNYGISGNL